MKDKHFLYEYDNRAIVAFFLIMAIFNILVIFYEEDYIDSIITISGFSGVSIISILIWFFKKNKPIIYDESKNSSNTRSGMQFVGVVNDEFLKNNTDLPIVKREQHIRNITSLIENKFAEEGFKGIVLTGDSGSGKSILINMLKDHLKRKGYSVKIKRDFYNFDISLSGKQVIFLDQFENVLNYTNFINSIKEYNEENNCVFVFSFPHNYLSRMNNLFASNRINDVLKDVYILSLNEDDIQEYKIKISNFCAIDVSYIDVYMNNIFEENNDGQSDQIINNNVNCKKLCDELIKVIKGKAPLIELELLGYLLSFDYGNNKRFSKEYSFIDVFLDDWVNRFFNKETAYSILYLMSEFRTFSINDIRLATFGEPKLYIYDTLSNEDGLLLKALKDNPFIYTDNRYAKCGAKHQYISEQFRRYCQSKEIPDNIRYYSAHLIKCIDNKHDKNSEYSYNKLEENYKKYYSKHIGIYIMLVIMFIGVTIANIIKLNESVEVHCQLIVNSLVSFPSIYYIFNYCKHFFVISNSVMATLTYVIGAAGIILSYIFVNMWGIFFGFEILLLAFSILTVYRNKKSAIVNRIFVKDFIVFMCIGVIVIALGMIFNNLFSSVVLYGQESFWIIICKYSYYALFCIYAILSVLNHINYSYIIGRIGLSNIVK